MLEELKEANEYISSKIDKYKSPNLELIKEIDSFIDKIECRK